MADSGFEDFPLLIYFTDFLASQYLVNPSLFLVLIWFPFENTLSFTCHSL